MSGFQEILRRKEEDMKREAAAAVRVGRAERDLYIDYLSAMYAEERLTDEEFQSRSERAATARTIGYLKGLVADLPPMPLPPAGRKPVNSALVWATAIVGVLMMTCLILLAVYVR